MKNDTIIEILENEFRTGAFSGIRFKENIDNIKQHNMYNLKPINYTYHQLDGEFDFYYALFRLYCFFDYSIEEIYNLIKEISRKYNKSDFIVSYSDFVEYTKVRHFKERKNTFLKTSPEYQEKVKMLDSVKSDNIKNVIDDYNDTSAVIECLNEDMKEICNNEDISAEKRIEYIQKYSKISSKLSEKRSLLFQEIKKVVL